MEKVITHAPPKKGRRKKADVQTEPTLSYQSYFTVDSFISNCLFLVQAENIFSDKVYIYQVFWSSIQYICSFTEPRLALKEGTLIQNPNLDEGWYFMPTDFAGWYANFQPYLYKMDDTGAWSFQPGLWGGADFADGGNFLYYSSPALNNSDPIFILVLRWHFLRELALAQTSLAAMLPAIEARYQEYMTIYRSRTYADNRKFAETRNDFVRW